MKIFIKKNDKKKNEKLALYAIFIIGVICTSIIPRYIIDKQVLNEHTRLIKLIANYFNNCDEKYNYEICTDYLNISTSVVIDEKFVDSKQYMNAKKMFINNSIIPYVKIIKIKRLNDYSFYISEIVFDNIAIKYIPSQGSDYNQIYKRLCKDALDTYIEEKFTNSIFTNSTSQIYELPRLLRQNSEFINVDDRDSNADEPNRFWIRGYIYSDENALTVSEMETGFHLGFYTSQKYDKIENTFYVYCLVSILVFSLISIIFYIFKVKGDRIQV